MTKDDRELMVGEAVSAIASYCREMEKGGKEPKFSDLPDVLRTAVATRLEALQAQPVGERGWLSGYPDYLADPAGLERMRQSVIEAPDRHDMASINFNSLARLIDTIDNLRAALTASPPVVKREAKPSYLSVIPVRGHLEKHAVFDAIMGDAIAVCPDEIAAQRVFDALTKADAILALTPVEGVGERKTGWLIERDDPQGLLYRMASRFDRDHMKALRFARREDAQAFCDAFLTDYRHTVAHPQYTRIAEHAWD